MMKKMIGCTLPLFALLLIGGCGKSPDAELMKTGLIKSGMPADQADCMAEALKKTAKGEPYNYMAKLMNDGMTEREAFNKARRKFGADFRGAVQDARAACVQ